MLRDCDECCVFLSGLHSDSDPSPGLGVARSLRRAYRTIRLIGVDYSLRASGIHDQVLDEVVVNPPWSDLDLTSYQFWIKEQIEAGCVWFSGLDVEAHWLVGSIRHPRLLVPPRLALQATAKPSIPASETLQLHVPKWKWAEEPLWALHEFARRTGWQVWVKGVFHEAYAAHTFAELQEAIDKIEGHWPLEQVFVQQHVIGDEVSYVFAAHQGTLLGAAQVEKRLLTDQGKTWGARVTSVEQTVHDALADLVTATGWHGGGEIEMVRTGAGELFLLDINPRFPAYIDGVTVAGLNLPAMLLSATLGDTGSRYAAPHLDGEFVRVISEIPVRKGYALPRIPVAADRRSSAGKHPSGQPLLARRVAFSTLGRPTGLSSPSVTKPRGYRAVIQAALDRPPTPLRLTLPFVALEVCSEFAASTTNLKEPDVAFALSVKTQPDSDLGRAALSAGWSAECISPEEVVWAEAVGFAPGHIIANGPLAVQTTRLAPNSIAIAFADSNGALESLLEQPTTVPVIGARLRLPGVDSRFGVPVRDPSSFASLVRLLRQRAPRQWGLHMHVASDVVGAERWWSLVDHFLGWAGVIADSVGIGPSVLDFGGGWQLNDFEDLFLPKLQHLHTQVAQAIPSVRRVVLEPGKAVSRPSSALLTRVLERRNARNGGGAEVVVDASIADLPMAPLYPHRIAALTSDGDVRWLGTGHDVILGAICMESDRLASRVGVDPEVNVGDLLIFFDSGGYDASMAWPFGRGRLQQGDR